jgi:hypothetical protein
MSLWPGLLEWSTSFSDGTSQVSNVKPLSEEDKQFLKGAFSSMESNVLTAEKIMQRLSNALKTLKTNFEQAIVDLDDCSDFPECAENFHKHEEFFEHVDAFIAENEQGGEEKVSRLLSVLNLYISNNPVLQLTLAKKQKFLPKLMQLAMNQGNALAVVKSIGAVIRGVPQLEQGFIKEKGDLWLLEVAKQSEKTEVKEKCLQLVEHLKSVVPIEPLPMLKD